METFVESGMTFGPYEARLLFRIEASRPYRVISENVQISEFLLLRCPDAPAPSVWIVEAKQSSPRPETQPNFQEFIEEMRDKLTNALTLGVSSILKRHPTAQAELPEPFKTLDLGVVGFRLVLVINKHKREWLSPIQDALRKELHATVRTWALGANAVSVINEHDAKKYGLIS